MELAGNLVMALVVLAAGLVGWAAMELDRDPAFVGKERAGGGAGRIEHGLSNLVVRGSQVVAAGGLCTAGLLVAAFFLDDFHLRAVQTASSRTLSWGFKLSLLWVDLNTSLLFWAALMAVVSYFAVRWTARKAPRLLGVTAFISMALVVFFFVLVLLKYNPFDPYLVESPLYGAGMKPTLRNFWMLIHPPVQYAGYVTAAVPFVITVAAMTRRDGLDDRWMRAVRPWVALSWLLLGAGMVLGMVWAYSEVDWGGYWNWDPVENSSLMPFLVATVAMHAIMPGRGGRHRRGWAVSAILLMFWMTIIGTFITRTGVLDSVHTFGHDPTLAWAFGGLLVLGGLGSAALALVRLLVGRAGSADRDAGGRVADRRDFGHFEAAGRATSGRAGRLLTVQSVMTLGNWILLLSALVVLVGTVGPLGWRVATGHRIKVGASFFELWLRPAGVLLVAAIAAAYALWEPAPKRASRWGVRLAPGLVGFVAGAAFALVRFAGSTWALVVLVACGFAAGQILAVMVVLARRARRASRCDDVLGAHRLHFVASLAVAAVHLGIVVVLFGLTGRVGLVKKEALIRPGQSMRIVGGQVLFVGVTERPTLNQDRLVATVALPGGQVVQPALAVDLEAPDMPSVYGVGRTGFGADTQIRLRGMTNSGLANLQVMVHPLALWIWVGFGLMGLAGLLVAWTLFHGDLRVRSWWVWWFVLLWTLAAALVLHFVQSLRLGDPRLWVLAVTTTTAGLSGLALADALSAVLAWLRMRYGPHRRASAGSLPGGTP